jgi:predicted nucleic acid-binding protein
MPGVFEELLKLNTKLFTMDKKLLRAFPNYALSITAG